MGVTGHWGHGAGPGVSTRVKRGPRILSPGRWPPVHSGRGPWIPGSREAVREPSFLLSLPPLPRVPVPHAPALGLPWSTFLPPLVCPRHSFPGHPAAAGTSVWEEGLGARCLMASVADRRQGVKGKDNVSGGPSLSVRTPFRTRLLVTHCSLAWSSGKGVS